MTSLHRLVYASKSALPGPESEIAEAVAQILQVSQANNARVGVTGALLFNSGAFAQVLEGPLSAVEATFERIQRDPRHGEVTVLQCAPVAERGFQNWSMAFVGQSARGQSLWGGIAAASGFDATRLDADEVFKVLHGLVLDEEGVVDPVEAPVLAPAPEPAPAMVVPADLGPRAQMQRLAQTFAPVADGAGYAEALRSARGGQPVGASSEGGALLALELSIVKKALRAERHRLAEMAARVEEMQAALVVADERCETLRRGRDLWAERARLLSLPVFQGLAAHAAGEEPDAPRAADQAGSAIRSAA